MQTQFLQEKISNNKMTLRFGAWSKEEAGIVDDVAKLDTVDAFSWQVNIGQISLDGKSIWNSTESLAD